MPDQIPEWAMDVANQTGRMFQQHDGSQKRFITPEECARALAGQEDRACKAVCQFCRRRMIVESTSKGYVHPSGGAFHHCAASEIRAANRGRVK